MFLSPVVSTFPAPLIIIRDKIYCTLTYLLITIILAERLEFVFVFICVTCYIIKSYLFFVLELLLLHKARQRRRQPATTTPIGGKEH